LVVAIGRLLQSRMTDDEERAETACGGRRFMPIELKRPSTGMYHSWLIAVPGIKESTD
jgi:hypothetical protein